MVNLSLQQWEIYLLLKEKIGSEVHISEITNDKRYGGLGIKGYSERMTELRKKGYAVVNTRKNHYQIQGEPEPTISDLRQIWAEAKKRSYFGLMKRCEKKAKQVKFAGRVREALV